MSPKEKPPARRPAGEGGNDIPGESSEPPTPSQPLPLTQRYPVTQHEIELAASFGLTYDPQPGDPNVRRYFRRREGCKTFPVDSFPWPKEITFNLTSSLQKKVRMAVTQFYEARDEISKNHPGLSIQQIEALTRNRLLTAFPTVFSRHEALHQGEQEQATGQNHPAPTINTAVQPKSVERVATNVTPPIPSPPLAPLRPYVVMRGPSERRPQTPIIRLTRRGERYLQPGERCKRLYTTTRTILVAFDGWPATDVDEPERATVIVDFRCTSKTYMAEQVLSLLDLELVVPSDTSPAFRWQAHTGQDQWTTLTARDDIPDFGSDDLTLRVFAAKRRSVPPRRDASARHRKLWSSPWHELFEPCRQDALTALGGVTTPELTGFLFLSTDHRNFSINFLFHIRSSPLYIVLLDQVENTTDGYSWWSLTPLRTDGDRVTEEARWAALKQVTAGSSQHSSVLNSNPPHHHDSDPRDARRSKHSYHDAEHREMRDTTSDIQRPTKKRKAVDPRPPRPESPSPTNTSQAPPHVTSPPVPSDLIDDGGIPVDYEAPADDLLATTQRSQTPERRQQPLLTTDHTVPPYIIQTDVKALARTRVTQARLTKDLVIDETNHAMSDFRNYLKRLVRFPIVPTFRFPRPIVATHWALPAEARPPWPRRGKRHHPALMAQDVPAVWYVPGVFSETYPMPQLDPEAGLPSLPTFQHLASLMYLSAVAIRPVQIAYRIIHPTPAEKIFLSRFSDDQVANNTVCIDSGAWLSNALDSNLFVEMHPLDLHNRLNEITGCTLFQTTTNTDDVVTYAALRDRHNHLIEWAIKHQDPGSVQTEQPTPKKPIVPWFLSFVLPVLEGQGRDDVINQCKEHPGPVIDVLLAASPADDDSGYTRITCSRIRTCHVPTKGNMYTAMHYAEPVSFRALLFPRLTDDEWLELPMFTTWKEGPMTKPSEYYVNRLAQDLSAAIGSTVPHQKLQRLFPPGADTR